jgi:hypothetical protein
MKERLRGKPRRGSPWKPRRPPVSPSVSQSTCSSSRPQSPSIAATPPPSLSMPLHSTAAPSPPQSRLLHSMATLQRGSSPTLSRPQDPRMQFIATMSFPGPSSSLGSAPPAHSASKRLRPHPADHPDNEHFRDRLGILFDLVFELRKEVADLKFRSAGYRRKRRDLPPHSHVYAHGTILGPACLSSRGGT